MPTYTVKPGDTLSSIGAKNGVNYNSITGYKSGNPNLIYPGEVLSWGGGSSAKKSSGKAPAVKKPAAKKATTWQDRVKSLYTNVGTFDKNSQNPVDIYNATLEKLGIGDARTRVTSLREQLLNTESLLRNVAGDVQARTQDALVSENQRRRLTAMEEEPLGQQAGILGRNLEMADANYKDILGEGKAQSEMQYQYQKDQRAALMDRLKIAIGEAKTAEDKRRWTKEYNRLKAKDKAEEARWQKEFALKQQTAFSRASGGGGSGGGGSSGGGGGGSKVTAAAIERDFLGYIDGKWKSVGGAGKYKASRQQQDAWANAYFASNGIKDPEARQRLWNAMNSKYNRTADPTKDWLYKR